MDVERINFLMDFYGPLLTELQVEIMTQYLDDGLTYSEIADNLSSTRQAVYDNINRSISKLESFEEKLGLFKRFKDDRVKLQYIYDSLKELLKDKPEALALISKELEEILY